MTSSLIPLLSDPSACLRFRVLTELAGLPPEDREVKEVEAQRSTDHLYVSVIRSKGGFTIRSAVIDLRKLTLLGFDRRCQAVRERTAFLFSQQKADGSWPIGRGAEEHPEHKGYSMIPLQTAIPLIGLSGCGYATDKRAEKAYRWLEEKRLDDGSWPTGVASGVFGGVAGYRRLPHSRWGCRSNTAGALIALTNHPDRRTSEVTRRAADHLLAAESYEASALGFETARSIGAEKTRGLFTFFATLDPGMLLDCVSSAGFSRGEHRVERLIRFIENERSSDGLWRYKGAPQASRWVTFQLLKTLAGVTESGELYGEEPPTPFSSYPRRERRY